MVGNLNSLEMDTDDDRSTETEPYLAPTEAEHLRGHFPKLWF